MSDILTERSGGILRIQLNRPQKKNAMTSIKEAMSAFLEKRAPDFSKSQRPAR
jgi:1,4-dihydroxy-2-naphthoyl-CoA synthase